MKKLNLVGQRFGQLVALRENGKRKNGNIAWLCICDCGNIHDVAGGNLKTGCVTSCGCKRRTVGTKHGHCRTKTVGKPSTEYQIWSGMKSRCHNSNNTAYRNYGARGISVCLEWRQSFKTFLDHVGFRPIGTTLDRINNDGNYEPGNVRWATKSEQMANTRTSKNLPVRLVDRLIQQLAKLPPQHSSYHRARKLCDELEGIREFLV